MLSSRYGCAAAAAARHKQQIQYKYTALNSGLKNSNSKFV